MKKIIEKQARRGVLRRRHNRVGGRYGHCIDYGGRARCVGENPVRQLRGRACERSRNLRQNRLGNYFAGARFDRENGAFAENRMVADGQNSA